MSTFKAQLVPPKHRYCVAQNPRHHNLAAASLYSALRRTLTKMVQHLNIALNEYSLQPFEDLSSSKEYLRINLLPHGKYIPS
jgi:hypothetical protein